LTCLRTLSEISSDGMYIWALEFMCAVAIDYKGILSDTGDPASLHSKIRARPNGRGPPRRGTDVLSY